MSGAEAPVGLLLAAGRGTRFAPDGRRDKLLATLASGPEAGMPVARASALHMLAALPRVIALVRPEGIAVATVLVGAGCEIIRCDDASEGMGRVIARGVEAAGEASGYVIALADMPFIGVETIGSVVTAMRAHPLVVPVHRGTRGHPVGFGRAYRDALRALQGDTGARAILARETPHLVEVDDAGITRDVDTADDPAIARDA